eukprot:scaffold92078_cov37-Tisochrysis_lutea.AAC.1
MLSAFAWLTSLVLCAALWALASAAQLPSVSLVMLAVLLQELGRWAMYEAYVLLLRWMAEARLTLPKAGPASARLPGAAVANGVGIWLVQTFVLYGDVLWQARLPGSVYTPMCSVASMFAVDAVCACGIGSVNVLLSLIGWTTAYPRRSRGLAAVMVALHALASLATSLNSADWLPVDGCVAAIPALASVVLITGWCAGWCILEGFAKKELLFESADMSDEPEAARALSRRRRLNSRPRVTFEQ